MMGSFRRVASLWLRKAISEKHVKNLQKIKEEDLPFDHLFSGKRRQVIDPKDFGGLATGSKPRNAEDLQKFLRDTDILEEGDEIDWKNGKIFTKDGKIKSRLGKGINKGIRKSVGGDKKLFLNMAKVKKGLGKDGGPMNLALGARWKDSIQGLVGMAHLFDPEFPTEEVWKELKTYGVPSDSGWKQIRKIADKFAKLSPDDRKKMQGRYEDEYEEAQAKLNKKRFETLPDDFRRQYWDARGLFQTHIKARTEKDAEWMLGHFNKWKDRVDELYESEDGDTIRSLYDEAKKTPPERLKALKDLSSVEEQTNEYNLWKGTYGEELAIVLSRDPLDVLRMSDHPKAVQAIESCHSEGGSEFSCAIEEAEEGGLIAYVVKKSDLEGVDLEDGELFEDHTRKVKGIKPVSRLRLRRFEKESKRGGDEEGDGLEVAIPEIDTYGAGFPKFVNVMTEWARKEQPEFYIGDDDYSKSPGDWKLTGGEYQDTPSSELFQNFFGGGNDDEDSGPTEDQYDPYGEGYTEDDSPYYDPDAEEEDESEAQVSVKKVRPHKGPPQDFWDWMDKHHPEVPNPNPRGREQQITPSTLRGYARGRTNYTQRAQSVLSRYVDQYKKLREEADSSKKVASTWLRRIVLAAFSPDFYRQIGIQRFRHPETGNHVLFYSLPQEEQQRIHGEWQAKQSEHKTPVSRRDMGKLKSEMRRSEREKNEAEAKAGQADRREMAKALKELKSKNLPKRNYDKEKRRLVQEMESRALAREKERKQQADAA